MVNQEAYDNPGGNEIVEAKKLRDIDEKTTSARKGGRRNGRKKKKVV